MVNPKLKQQMVLKMVISQIHTKNLCITKSITCRRYNYDFKKVMHTARRYIVKNKNPIHSVKLIVI